MNNYAIIKSKENSLTVSEIIEVTGGQAMPLLWIGSEGRYCLLPKEVIQNLLELHGSLQQAKDLDFDYGPTLQIVWSQGIEINNGIGRILADE